MAMEFHFNSNATSESLHIDKQLPAFLRADTQVICLSVSRSRVSLRSRNPSVTVIAMLGVWYECLYTHRIKGHGFS